MTREEWQAMILRHDKELKDLREQMQGLGKNSRKPAAAVKDQAQTKLADVWIEMLQGKPPGYLFSSLMPVISEHGWDRVEPVLRFVLRRTETKYLRSAVTAIPATFGALEGELGTFLGRKPQSMSAQDEHADGLRWIKSKGGNAAVVARVLETAGDSKNSNRDFIALAVLGAPPSTHSLISGLLKQARSIGAEQVAKQETRP